jgi:hypothetical protein
MLLPDGRKINAAVPFIDNVFNGECLVLAIFSQKTPGEGNDNCCRASHPFSKRDCVPDNKLARQTPNSRFDQLDNLSGSRQPDAVFFSAIPDDAKLVLIIFALIPYSSNVHIHGDRKGSFAE